MTYRLVYNPFTRQYDYTEDVDSDLGDIDARLDADEAAITHLSTRADDAETRLDAAEGRLDDDDTELADHEDRIEALEDAPPVSSSVPTHMLAGETFTVPDRVQMLFEQVIDMDAGALISLGTEALLAGVT